MEQTDAVAILHWDYIAGWGKKKMHLNCVFVVVYKRFDIRLETGCICVYSLISSVYKNDLCVECTITKAPVTTNPSSLC